MNEHANNNQKVPEGIKAKSDGKSPQQEGTRMRGGRNRTRTRTARSDFLNKVIDIRRVSRVVKGGRRFSFSVSMVVGDKKGRVGVGLGKGADTIIAIEKATNQAKKNLVTVAINKDGTIPHDVYSKYSASKIQIHPSKKGLVASGAVRVVLDLAGVRQAAGKIITRSKNHLNNARATVSALGKLQ